MSWPLSQDYNEAIQTPAASFADPELRTGQVQVNTLGLPLPRSGNFADVYQVQCPAATWAVKCFTRQVAGQRERYSEVSRHLQAAKLPFAVDFQYLEQGIRVRKQWYPVLKMRWVEGLLLNAFVRDNLDKPAVLYQLAQIWVRMAKRLREAKVAHADLQHGNVLLVPGSKTASLAVKLIDYDGTWVPALAGKKSGEVGHPAYQHPQRLREGTYSPEVDRFPELVVATALRALALGGKPLWQRYDNGDNLLFREADLRAPANSALFGELRGLADPLLGKLVGALQGAAQGKLEETPLLVELLVEEKRPVEGKVAVAAAPGMDWSFTDEDRPRVRRRRKRAGVGLGVWAAAAAAALLAVSVGGVYFATRGGEGKPNATASHKQAGEAWRDLDVSEASFPNGIPRLEGGQCLFTRRSYKGGVDITVEARTTKNTICLTAGPGLRVVFNSDGKGGMLLDHLDNPSLDGRGKEEGTPAASELEKLEPNRWYKLRWQLTPTSMKVWVDGKQVLHAKAKAKQGYDLSTPRPVGVCSCDSPIEVRSVEVKLVVVKPVPAAPGDKP
jgi:hypothetical protein